MRGTAVAAAVLLLAGCGDGSEEPEAPEPGPLDLVSGEMACSRGVDAGTVVVTLAAPGNTADIPLTIDEVTLVGAVNAELGEAFVGNAGAVDFTMPEFMQLGGRSALTLVLRSQEPEGTLGFDAIAVDYHNVEGRFRAESGSMDLTDGCRR